MADFRGVTDENFGRRSRESDQKIIDAGSFALHLLSMPEWRMVSSGWREVAAAAMDDRLTAVPDALKGARVKVAVMDSLERMLGGAVADAREVAAHPLAPEETPRKSSGPRLMTEEDLARCVTGTPAAPKQKWTDETAKEAVRMGDAAKRVVEHPAWKWLMARLSALMWAYDQALQGGYAIDDVACQTAILNIAAPIEQVAQRLHLGLEARAFLDGTTRDRQEPSNG